MIVEATGGAPQVADGGLRCVRLGGREVGEHLAPVGPLPREGVELGLRETVPEELLREEARDAGAAHELRQLPVVAERIRAPELGAAHAEPRLEPALPVQELTDERFSGGDVAIRLDPGAARRDEAAAGHCRANPRPELGDAALDPVVVLRRGAREPVPGVLVEQPELRRPRAHGLALRLRERPQPGRVEVRVPDGRNLVGRRAVPARVQALEDRGIELVAEPVQLGAELARPGGIEPALRLGLERAERLEVPVELPRAGIEQPDLAALDRHVLVAGELDLEARPRKRRVVVPAVEPVQRAPVLPERRLASGLPQEPGMLAFEVRLELEPPGRPARAEALARIERPVLEQLRLLPRDPPDRACDQDPVHRTQLPVDVLAEQGRGLRQPLPAVAVVADRQSPL